MATATPLYSIIVPFYNEEECAPALLAEIRKALDGLAQPAEVIFVDDGSTDHTLSILNAAAKEWNSLVTVHSMQRNSGQAAALLAGFAIAQGAIFITLDGDGQNDPADIPALLEALNNADYVTGRRVARNDSRLRKSMSRLANFVRSRFLSDGVSDTGCALKAFRREVVSSFIPIRTLYSFMPALAVGAGFRVTEHPVNHRHRAAGTSKYGLAVMLWRPLLDMLGVWWFLRRRIRVIAAP